MALDVNTVGGVTGNKQEVDASGRALVRLPDATTPANVGGIRMFSENDAGSITGTPYLYSPETDEDYRLRISQEFLFDTETFNYTAQNTGKHTYVNTTMANAWSASGLTTNSTNITAAGGTTFGTYAEFPMFGASILYAEFAASITAQPTANTIIDFGFFRRGAANPFTPTDGAYFRLTSAGLMGVINSSTTETTTSVFDFAYTNNKTYQFMISIHERETQFWIDDVLYAVLATPVGQGQPFMSSSLPLSIRHAIVGGAAGVALSFNLRDYTVSIGGPALSTTASTAGLRMHGSYQGLSGGTMGSLARIGTITTGNEANVTAAVPTTTTAALGSGLGGTFWETVSLALNTDGIIMSYQVPAGTVNVQGRRLVLRGLYLNSYVQTVIVGGPYTAEWFLAFGHTAVSLATTETAATKAPRRIDLPFVQQVTAAQAVNTNITNLVTFCDFGDAPIYVNPGEFIQLCTRHLGTVGTSGTVVHRVTLLYGWE